MTNKISSAEQAKEALIKLRSKGAFLHVEFTVLFANFSFDGYITKDFDGDAVLTLAAPKFGNENPPTLILSGLEIAKFDGDFREDDTGMFLALDISKPTGDATESLYRVHLVGGWSPQDKKSRHVN